MPLWTYLATLGPPAGDVSMLYSRIDQIALGDRRIYCLGNELFLLGGDMHDTALL